jgi:hypothetical protein
VLGHKLNSYLAFQLGSIGGLAQLLGRHIEEAKRTAPARWPLLPAILPAMAVISAGARVLDRMLPDGTEALSYLVIARHMPDARA